MQNRVMHHQSLSDAKLVISKARKIHSTSSKMQQHRHKERKMHALKAECVVCWNIACAEGEVVKSRLLMDMCSQAVEIAIVWELKRVSRSSSVRKAQGAESNQPYEH
jgi:hypothetical protein